MNRILITGAGSFIGTNYMDISKNQNIREISVKENQPEEIDFSPFDVVLHLAAIVHQSKKIKKQDYIMVNRNLCIRVAEQAKRAGVKHFVFLSTVKVYGKFIPGSDPWNEDSVCYPEDDYGKSKFEAEVALRFLDDPCFTVSIIRTPLVYGDGVKANMLNLIKLVHKIRILPFAKIENRRSYTYIENLIAYIDRIIEKRLSGIFIAMDDNPLSSTELVDLISKYLDKKVILFKLPALFVSAGFVILPGLFRPIFGSYELDNTKTKKLLNMLPPFTHEAGIQKMIISYKNRQHR
jgi:nucleoside-diphosphate-sugar epimerase